MKDPKRNSYMTAVFAQMMADLRYPQSKDGTIMRAEGIAPLVSWHLVRCGWRKPNNTDNLALIEQYDEPVIKARRVYGPGVSEDAVVWVGVNEPDDPLENLANMTMAEVEALPDDVRPEAKRRLGILPPATQPETTPGWNVQPFVSITDAPDENTEWSN